MGSLREVFSFPHPVNEYAARTVAGLVAILALLTITFDLAWMLPILLYGFLARVLTGPSLSPIGQLATRVLVPVLNLPEKDTAGPPKRFAQTVGLIFATTTTVLYFGAGSALAAYSVLGVLVVFALLESVVGFCAGCFVFAQLMRIGLVPEKTCEKCNNLSFGGA
ncbi:MAG: DUF4395 domain-containing protein [Chloroflexota bacterium]|jgi:hypothetical protein|nr:DUF4395 domain-containing protein [Chloroflexota bacterium]MDP6757570.1 DUF4395 domain-containing protein [Chloroflexota bacterium]